jgi:hypothetical protein
MRQWRPQGGPIARDGGEGGAVGAASEQRRKHGVGQRKPAGGGGSTVLKGAGGDAADRGGVQGLSPRGGWEWGRQKGAPGVERARRGRARQTGGPGVHEAQWAVTGCGASTMQRGADMRARQHSATRFGFQTESNLFQTDSNLPQILIDPKGAFPCSKNWK